MAIRAENTKTRAVINTSYVLYEIVAPGDYQFNVGRENQQAGDTQAWITNKLLSTADGT